MPADATFGSLSNHLLVASMVAYSLAMLGFAAEFSFGRRSALTRVLDRGDSVPVRVAGPAPARVLVGSAGSESRSGSGFEVPAGSSGATSTLPAGPLPGRGAGRPGSEDAAGPPGRLGQAALALTVVGWAVHVGSVVARGFAAHRVPWGNMYEFSSMVALVAVTAFLVLAVRERVRYLGAFVLLPVVLYLGLAGTVLYVPAAPLVPALNSYWIKIHVVAAITATGTFMVSGVVIMLFLLRARYEDRVAAGRPAGVAALAHRLPSAAALDRTSYRVTAFAFPVWTFAVIAGAIWAEAAWGRYWGWDPKETWSFITWVVYAGYLHARTTAGWKGRRAAYLGLLGFAALMVDYYWINIGVSGLHSYSGV